MGVAVAFGWRRWVQRAVRIFSFAASPAGVSRWACSAVCDVTLDNFYVVRHQQKQQTARERSSHAKSQTARASSFSSNKPTRSMPLTRLVQIESASDPSQKSKRATAANYIIIIIIMFGKKSFPAPCVMGDESIMAPKAHGTSETPVQKNLRWKCDYETADRICNYK